MVSSRRENSSRGLNVENNHSWHVKPQLPSRIEGKGPSEVHSAVKHPGRERERGPQRTARVAPPPPRREVAAKRGEVTGDSCFALCRAGGVTPGSCQSPHSRTPRSLISPSRCQTCLEWCHPSTHEHWLPLTALILSLQVRDEEGGGGERHPSIYIWKGHK